MDGFVLWAQETRQSATHFLPQVGSSPYPERPAQPGLVGSLCTSAAATSLSSGCLLDFLKTDEGNRLSLPRLIDMSAQVCENLVQRARPPDPLPPSPWLNKINYLEVVSIRFRLGCEGRRAQSHHGLNV